MRMVSVRDVKADALIKRASEKLKEFHEIKPPLWASYVKTSSHAQRVPSNPDWWYVRAASLLRRTYLHSPIGVNKLRSWYGGRKKRGTKPEKHVDAGGKIIRLCFQQLEKIGFVQKVDKKGRTITSKGQKFLNEIASELKR